MASTRPRHVARRTVADALDRQTRERLLSTATQLFAERGFAGVTVREICLGARANVAAINYHFGGKQGLYDTVIRLAIEKMQATTRAMQSGSAGRPAEEQLRLYVSIFLTRVVAARDNWIHRLMVREMAEPTSALDAVVTEVVQPRMAYLRSLIAALLRCPANDTRVHRCAMSVQAQCLAPLMHPAATRPMTERQIDALARHITRFSLGGIRDLRA